jgi:hypothetical protein
LRVTNDHRGGQGTFEVTRTPVMARLGSSLTRRPAHQRRPSPFGGDGPGAGPKCNKDNTTRAPGTRARERGVRERERERESRNRSSTRRRAHARCTPVSRGMDPARGTFGLLGRKVAVFRRKSGGVASTTGFRLASRAGSSFRGCSFCSLPLSLACAPSLSPWLSAAGARGTGRCA